MKMEKHRQALTVFLDIRIEELKNLLAFKSFPIIVVSNSLEVIGVLDEALFWRHIVADGCQKPISNYLNYRFTIIGSLSDLSEEDVAKYDYFIVKDDEAYICYQAMDIEEYQYQQKITSLLNMNHSLREELESSKRKSKELTQIFNSSFDEIYVTDADGNTLYVSETCERLTGLPPEAFLHKNIKELVEKGFIVNSVTLKTMESKTVQSAEQVYPNGKTIFTTAKPIFDEEGKLYRIISNSRDISELAKMRDKLAKANSLINQQIGNQTGEQIVFFNKLITRSENMISVIKLAEKVAPMDSSIFIHGESGVGKGVLARIIHDLSPRKHKNFIQINCGAIPSHLIESELFGYEAGAFTGANKNGKVGLVEMANGGTLFLDEIGEMPLDVQVKILHLVQDKTFKRVGGTQEKQVDIRIISATHKNIKEMIEQKTFRLDLYYRLHVVPIHIPPLRDRKQDILLLIERFLDKFNEKYSQSISLNDSSKLLLQLHEWPGNVRELENLIEQIVVTSQIPNVSIEDLPLQFNKNGQQSLVKVTGIMPIKQAVEETERQILSYAVTKYKTTRKVAQALGVNQTTIMRKLHKYQLTTSEKMDRSF